MCNLSPSSLRVKDSPSCSKREYGKAGREIENKNYKEIPRRCALSG